MAFAHLCVTRAMARELEVGWGIRGAVTVHDRPPPQFRPFDEAERREALRALASGVEGNSEAWGFSTPNFSYLAAALPVFGLYTDHKYFGCGVNTGPNPRVTCRWRAPPPCRRPR